MRGVLWIGDRVVIGESYCTQHMQVIANQLDDGSWHVEFPGGHQTAMTDAHFRKLFHQPQTEFSIIASGVVVGEDEPDEPTTVMITVTTNGDSRTAVLALGSIARPGSIAGIAAEQMKLAPDDWPWEERMILGMADYHPEDDDN